MRKLQLEKSQEEVLDQVYELKEKSVWLAGKSRPLEESEELCDWIPIKTWEMLLRSNGRSLQT